MRTHGHTVKHVHTISDGSRNTPVHTISYHINGTDKYLTSLPVFVVVNLWINTEHRFLKLLKDYTNSSGSSATT